MTTPRSECADKGLGSRGRRGNTCAGKMLVDRDTDKPICDFHAQVRCFVEALREVERS